MEKFVERRKSLTLKHKLKLMASTLRNCKLKQGLYTFYEKDIHDKDRFCAYGALGHMAGIPKDVLETHPYELVLERYGMTEKDRRTLVSMDNTRWGQSCSVRTEPFEKAMFLMNDYEYKTFDEIADWLDNLQG